MRRAIVPRDSDESGTPSRVTRPLAGLRVPASRRSSVVLPEPFGPIKPMSAPVGTSSDTPWMTGLSP